MTKQNLYTLYKRLGVHNTLIHMMRQLEREHRLPLVLAVLTTVSLGSLTLGILLGQHWTFSHFQQLDKDLSNLQQKLQTLQKQQELQELLLPLPKQQSLPLTPFNLLSLPSSTKLPNCYPVGLSKG